MQELFSKHIIHAPGMERLESLTDRQIIPTPGAVLKGAEMFAEVAGDVLVLDVGGATTDVHSVTEGSREFADKLVDPEPHAKRTSRATSAFTSMLPTLLKWPKKKSAKARRSDQAMPATDSEREMTDGSAARL